MLPLPNDVLSHIYSYDATYHETYRKVLDDLVTTRELTELFENDIWYVVEKPRRLAKYSKKDFECFARYLGILTSRKSAEAPPRILRSKITRKRLIAKLCCYYLQKGKLWRIVATVPNQGMWIFC